MQQLSIRISLPDYVADEVISKAKEKLARDGYVDQRLRWSREVDGAKDSEPNEAISGEGHRIDFGLLNDALGETVSESLVNYVRHLRTMRKSVKKQRSKLSQWAKKRAKELSEKGES